MANIITYTDIYIYIYTYIYIYVYIYLIGITPIHCTCVIVSVLR